MVVTFITYGSRSHEVSPIDSEGAELVLTTIRDMHDELLECVNGEDAGNTNGDAVAEEIIQMAEELLLQDHVPPLLWYPLALAYWYLNMPTWTITAIVRDGKIALDTAIAESRAQQMVDATEEDMGFLESMLDDRDAIDGLSPSIRLAA